MLVNALNLLLIAVEPVQDSLGRLADVHAIEEAQGDRNAWAALSKECASSHSLLRSTTCGDHEERDR